MAGTNRPLKTSLIAIALGAIGLVGASSSGARAATVLKIDVAEATHLSEWVVRARVTALRSVDRRAQGDAIYTEVTLAIDRVYQGEGVPATHVMHLMGGLGDDGLALTVPGMPRLTVGDEAVFFLERTGQGHVPCGLEQGVWRIARGPFGLPIVYRNLAGLSLMAKTPSGQLAPVHEQGPLPGKLLAELEREIAQARRTP